MTATYSEYGPPYSDSDCSSYDGFYFDTDIKRTRPEPIIAKDQKLYEALLNGDVETVSNEMDALNFAVDDPVRGGYTMLMYACREGHYDLAEYLIECRKANVNKQVDSTVALMVACDSLRNDQNEIEKIVKLLIKHGAIINVSDKFGMTPFMFSCRNGLTAVVQLLIKDVSLNAVDNQGCTPIFHAIEKNRGEIVKILIEAGVNINIPNNKGYTPRQVAEFHGFYDLLELFPREPFVYTVPTHFLGYSTLSDRIPRIFLKTECPEYFQELNSILHSINMENMLKYFAMSRTSLAEFLTMDDQKLKDVGVEFPIFRGKLMKGILDFHLHHWSKKSIARIKRHGMENFYDILMITANHIQHLVVMQASIRFVTQNQIAGKLGVPYATRLFVLKNNLKAYRTVVNDLNKTIKYLAAFSPQKSPLYIDYDEIVAERKRNKIRKYFKYTTIVLGISVYICFKCNILP